MLLLCFWPRVSHGAGLPGSPPPTADSRTPWKHVPRFQCPPDLVYDSRCPHRLPYFSWSVPQRQLAGKATLVRWTRRKGVRSTWADTALCRAASAHFSRPTIAAVLRGVSYTSVQRPYDRLKTSSSFRRLMVYLAPPHRLTRPPPDIDCAREAAEFQKGTEDRPPRLHLGQSSHARRDTGSLPWKSMCLSCPTSGVDTATLKAD
ncbi:hypothetical protein LY76DRAFT_348308 [Colletotrichum caudatum]|nr:hypothetical protein LY76DRAFT_348308 [Colletotrichum caudatum]